MAVSLGHPKKRHCQIELLAQHLQNELDPGFPTDRQSPEYRTPDQHCSRAISQGLEHVSPSGRSICGDRSVIPGGSRNLNRVLFHRTHSSVF